MLAPVTHILPITAIRRLRVLPFDGRVVVRKGQKVSPTDVIAEANLAPEHLLLDVARGLGLPANQADEYIQRHAGDQVSEGDVIAGPVGLARRVVRTPKPGRVVVAGSGQVLLELDSPPFELKAGISGVVTELVTDRGVEIETTGALIQGVWGNGRVDSGLLTNLSRSPQDVLTYDRLDVSHRGAIIMGCHCADAEVLSTAADIPLRGIILASMDASLIPLANRMRYPIILLEGFGNIPMNPVAFKLLSTSERREVAINAEAWERFEGLRPEIVIPLPASNYLPAPKEIETFGQGQKVRFVGALRKPIVGTLVTQRPGLTTLTSGIRVPAAEVRLESGEDVVLPLANLEVLD